MILFCGGTAGWRLAALARLVPIATLTGLVSLFFVPGWAAAATLSLSPTDGLEATSLAVRLDNGGGCVVAGQVEISYDASRFALADVDREWSVFTMWLPDATSTGRIILTGGVPGGYCGSFSGPGFVNTVATLRFVPLTADVLLRDAVSVATTSTLYDGYGFDVLER